MLLQKLRSGFPRVLAFSLKPTGTKPVKTRKYGFTEKYAFHLAGSKVLVGTTPAFCETVQCTGETNKPAEVLPAT